MKFKKFREYFKKSFFLNLLIKFKVLTSIFLITSSTTILFCLFTNISMPLESVLYDLNFLLRSVETTDENIRIVEWSDDDTILQKENVISDSTFLKLLVKIIEQRPKVVGMNIHRELLKYAPRLSAEQNVKDHEALKEIYGYVDNLIVVQKIIEPIIQAPEEINVKKQSAASDIPSSLVTRTSYIYPVLNKEEGILEEIGLPYLGAKVAYKHLQTEGYTIEENYDNKEQPSIIIRDKDNQKEKIIRPFKDGFDFKTKQGKIKSFDVIINWRKNAKDNKVFETISVSNILNDQTPENFFYNKIVLIGNTAQKIEQKYITPMSRWNKSKINQVEIAAHLASSLINHVVKDRPLINQANKYTNILLIIIPALAYSVLVFLYINKEPAKLFVVSTLFILIISILLLSINVIFLFKGTWLLVSIPIINTWILYLRSNYLNFKQAENIRVKQIELFLGDFEHSISNPSNSIASSNYRIQVLLNGYANDSNLVVNNNNLVEINTKDFMIISERNENISKQLKRLQRYQTRTQQFIFYNNSKTISPPKYTRINSFIQSTVDRIIDEIDEINEIGYDKHLINIQYLFDDRLKEVRIDESSIEIVIENLLKNSIFAVDPSIQTKIKKQSFIPTILIKTKLINNKFQFSVEDNGIGIPEKLLNKIFDPFQSFRTKYVYPGQGIGLFLTKRIIYLYGGKIDLESKLKDGSLFTITLPYQTQPD